MKIDSVTLENFRSYKNRTSVHFDELTVLVGRNDIGKSTILEALEIFFNEKSSVVKVDPGDINVYALKNGGAEFEISVIFSDLPERIILDSSVETTLREEYLLNKDEKLEIVKKYGKSGKPSVYIKALHPTNKACSDLLLKKNSDLKKMVDKEDLFCENKTVNALLRRVIWEKYKNNLDLEEILIEASKEDAKNIYEKIVSYLPVYSLFQADRKNTDGDDEVQDPLKEAVKSIFKNGELQNQLAQIAERVKSELEVVSSRTLSKLREIDPEIASSLKAEIPSVESLKWVDVFKSVSIVGDDEIPINKRGSGVKRLVLLSFFRAQAERAIEGETADGAIVYAIEEPETSQHNVNQKLLIEAIKILAKSKGVQVILTTHSSLLVKMLDISNIRIIYENNGEKCISVPDENVLNYPSLNEVNYLAYGDVSEEYHDELYAFLEFHKCFNQFKCGKKLRKYIKICKEGPKEQMLTLAEYIRHQIHHPENDRNARYTEGELKQSVGEMREFISRNKELFAEKIDFS